MKFPKREKRPAELTLTSMIDMFTLLIIYLLTQNAESGGLTEPPAGLFLPKSTAREASLGATKIFITKNKITVNNTMVAELDEKMKIKEQDLDGLLVKPLAEQIKKEFEKREVFSAQPDSTEEQAFKRRALVIADKDIPFETLRNTIITAGQEAIAEFSFAVMKQGQ